MVRTPSGSRSTAHGRDLGHRGEEAAARWYIGAGYDVVGRNWRCPEGELDLIAVDHRHATIVFCEVKTRTSGAFGAPEEAVTPTKQRRLRRLAARWLDAQRAYGSGRRAVRFDVAAVRRARDGGLVVDVLEDAF